MAISERQLRLALDECQAGVEHRRGELTLLVEGANRELSAWGHEGCDVTLERMVPFFADPGVLSCRFWCETCHVEQVALIPRPAVA